jgi:predicted O-methyltransferase YrrM
VDLERFEAKLPGLWDGDPQQAPHPRDRRFSTLAEDTGGMTSENKIALLNLAASCLEPGEIYLEVGAFRGTSIIGAALGNEDKTFVTIDDFSQFGGTYEACLANIERMLPPGQVRVINANCWDALQQDPADGRPVGVYFYDGGHDFDDQWQGLERAEHLLAERALVIVDDTGWPRVTAANRAYTALRRDYRLVRRFTSPTNRDPRWWNGIEVFAFRRTARSAPTPRRAAYHATKTSFQMLHMARVLGERVTGRPLGPRR